MDRRPSRFAVPPPRYLAVAVVGAVLAVLLLNAVNVDGPAGLVLDFLVAFVVFMGLLLLVERIRPPAA